MGRVRGIQRAYRLARNAALRIPGTRRAIVWLDPLQISRRLLWKALQRRAHYARGLLLDVGCGSKPYRSHFGHVRRYVGIDVPPVANADICASGLALPFADATFDTVLCTEVLEHVPEPGVLMSETARVLKPGGYLILTAAQTWGLHHEPHDYYRYTHYGLRHLAQKSGFEVIEASPTCGLWATIAQRVADTVVFNYASKCNRLVNALLSLMLAPLLILAAGVDCLAGKRGDTLDNILVARRY